MALRAAIYTVLGPGAVKEEKTHKWGTRQVNLGVTFDTVVWLMECPHPRIVLLREKLRRPQWFDGSSTLVDRQSLHGRVRHVAYVRSTLWVLVSVLVSSLGSGGVAGAYGCDEDEAWERFLDALQELRVVLDEPRWSSGASLTAPMAAALGHEERLAWTPPRLLTRIGSDASLTGGAAVDWATGQYFIVTWSPEELRKVRHLWSAEPDPDTFTIATFELVMVHLAIMKWGASWETPGELMTVVAANDNSNAVGWLTKRMSRSKYALFVLRLLGRAEAHYGVSILAVYIQSVANAIPDALSRLLAPDGSMLPDQVARLAELEREAQLSLTRVQLPQEIRHGMAWLALRSGDARTLRMPWDAPAPRPTHSLRAGAPGGPSPMKRNSFALWCAGLGVHGWGLPVYAIETAPAPSAVLRNVYGKEPLGDIRLIDFKALAAEAATFAVVVLATTPCTDFSTRGRQRGLLGRTGPIYMRLPRMIAASGAFVAIIEMVPGVLGNKNGETQRRFLELVSEAGYVATTGLMEAATFGAAAARPRVVTVAVRSDVARSLGQFTLPTGTQQPARLRDILEPDSDVSGSLWYTGTVTPVSPFVASSGARVVAVTAARHHVYDPDGIGPIQKTYGEYPAGPTGLVLRAGPRARRLSVREMARALGIPDTFPLPTSEHAARACIGGGLHVAVASALRLAVGAYLRPVMGVFPLQRRENGPGELHVRAGGPTRRVDELWETRDWLLGLAYAPATAEKHMAGFAQWAAFCTRHDADVWLRGNTQAEDKEQLIWYVCHLVGQQKIRHSTVVGRLGAVKHYHLHHGLGDVMAGRHRLQRVLAGLRKETGAVQRKLAATMDMVEWLANDRTPSRQDARDRQTIAAAATVAFFFMLRASEYVRTGTQVQPMTHVLQQRDMRFARQGQPVQWRQRHRADEVIVTIRSSKTDQERQGATRNLFATGHAVLCPVRAMASVARPLGPNADAPVFMRVDGKPVTRAQMSAAIKCAAAGTGREPARYSTHSLQSGGATALVAQGLAVAAIKRLGRWRSETWSQYGQETMGAAAGVAGLMLRASVHLLHADGG